MLKIRLFKMGYKKHPLYRIVAIDSRKKRNGMYKEKLGFFNPFNKFLTINMNRISILIKNGSQLSKRVNDLIKNNDLNSGNEIGKI